MFRAIEQSSLFRVSNYYDLGHWDISVIFTPLCDETDTTSFNKLRMSWLGFEHLTFLKGTKIVVYYAIVTVCILDQDLYSTVYWYSYSK